MSDLLSVPASTPMFFIGVSFLANATTHILNFYWFWKLCRSALRTLKKSTAPPEVKKQN
jgi:hypothetical protein